jgi:predicted Rossmann fold nucleotide-binding protein DprA/Smf involved in DNA uptake
MSSYIAVVGSRSLPGSWSSRVDSVVGSLLGRGLFVGSGGALGADLFALCSLVRRGRAACTGSVVFLPGPLGSAPSHCVQPLSRFVRLGGRVVVGPAPAHATKAEFVSALFARSRSLVSGSSGVVAFITGRSTGSWFSVHAAVALGLPAVVFPVEGPRSLRLLGAGRWVPLRCWAGAFRWVPARQDKGRCKHGLIGSFCSLCLKGGRS